MPAGPFRRYDDRSLEARLDVVAGIVTAYAENAAFKAGLDDTVEKPEDMAAIIATLASDAATVAKGDDDQATAYSVERAASAALKLAMPAAEAAYADVYDRAEAAGAEDPELAAALDFSPKEENRQKRLQQMKQFLDLAEAHLAKLKGYGVTAARIEAAREARAAAEAASKAYGQRDIDAQQSTSVRDALMLPVDARVRDLQRRGKVGFRDQPQLLEILGLRPIP